VLRSLFVSCAPCAPPFPKTISGREVESLAGRVEAGAGTCVGRPLPSIDIRIIAIVDSPVASMEDIAEVPQGEVGEICVRGAVVTRSYLHRPDATIASKITDIDRLWHRIGDLGYRDAEGRIWFCGRKVEAVFTASGPVFTDQIECRFSGLVDFPRVALVGVGTKGSARPVLVIEGADDPARREEAARISGLSDILFHPRFPVDRRHNAKIHRLRLARWAATHVR
jgi:olefin beta-lactone synthetase